LTIAAADAAAIVKLGRHFPKLRRVLETLRLLDDAVYVEHASWDSERHDPLAEVDPASVPYFATALVRRRGGA
jgi:precorrin-2 C20-methyltransferase / precorrin-3B C17-methyltransferase